MEVNYFQPKSFLLIPKFWKKRIFKWFSSFNLRIRNFKRKTLIPPEFENPRNWVLKEKFKGSV